MQYPLRKTFTIYLTLKLFWGKKTIRLEVPQATIGDIVDFVSMDNEEAKRKYIISNVSKWGAGRYAGKLVDFLGDHIEKILEDTFFFKRPTRKLPDSVIALATKEGMYDYESPDSVIFGMIASEYSLPPHELLKYTLDELYYLFEALQYKNLNENQKKELQRIKKAKEMMAQKPMLDAKVAELENYFDKK